MDDAGGLSAKLSDTILGVLEGLPLRDTTRHMVCNLLLDLPLSPAQQDDFGVYTPDHYRALRAVLEPTVGRPLRDAAVELDRCLGNGKALGKLVRKVAPDYADVRFATIWDALGSP